MKGHADVIAKLNDLLSRELAAINQYFVATELHENWGYAKLHAEERARAITEMKHAERLIERIIFLEGEPIVSRLGDIQIGRDVPGIVKNDLAAEYDAVKQYNEGVEIAAREHDNATKTLLESILNDEIGHVDQLEAFQDQIAQMGLANFLSTVTTKE